MTSDFSAMLSTRAADESWTSPSSQADEKFSRKNLAVVAGSDATIGASGTGPTLGIRLWRSIVNFFTVR